MANETYGSGAPVILELSGVKGAAGGGGGSGSAVMSEIMLDTDDASNFPIVGIAFEATKDTTPNSSKKYYVVDANAAYGYSLAGNNGTVSSFTSGTTYYEAVRSAYVVETGVEDSETNVGIADSFNYSVYLKQLVFTATSDSTPSADKKYYVEDLTSSNGYSLAGTNGTVSSFTSGTTYYEVSIPVIIHNPVVQLLESSDYNPVYVPASSLIFTDTDNTRVMMLKPNSWTDIMETGSGTIWEIWVRRVQVSAAQE